MANLEGNDIDDLFKRASDKYPLRTDSADWDKLAAALEKDPSLIVPPPTTEGDRRRRRGFFWLFLLLPLTGIGYYVWQTAGHPTLRTTASSKIESSQQAPAKAPASSNSPVPTQTGTGSTVITPESAGTITPAQSGTVPAGPAKPGAVALTPAQSGTVPAASAQPGSPSEGVARGVTPPPRTGSAKQGQITTAGADRHAPAAATTNTPAGNTGTAASNPSAASPGKYGSPAPAGPRKTKLPGKALHNNNQNPDPADETITSVPRPEEKGAYTAGKNGSLQGKINLTGTESNLTKTEYDPAFRNLNLQRARISEGVALNVSVKATNTTTTAKDSSSAKSVSKKNKSKKESSFYAGLLVAPDLSTVKFQSLKGVGTTYGVLLGYNINRKWAIETGAYLDHKKYYTDGEYFKKTDYPSYPNYKLLNVDGACNMIEIPVNIRYNLSSGVKTKWFATAGFSTYLMTSESYVSKYTYNGNTWPKSWDTSKPSQYWFSVFNLSVGYEQKLGKIGNLRLEPYLRVPLSGVGSGSLHIMSAGLNIGITRKLW